MPLLQTSPTFFEQLVTLIDIHAKLVDDKNHPILWRSAAQDGHNLLIISMYPSSLPSYILGLYPDAHITTANCYPQPSIGPNNKPIDHLHAWFNQESVLASLGDKKFKYICAAGISDLTSHWESFLSDCHSHLELGGWLEVIEADTRIKSQDQVFLSPEENFALVDWPNRHNAMRGTSELWSICTNDCLKSLALWDVAQITLKAPLGKWLMGSEAAGMLNCRRYLTEVNDQYPLDSKDEQNSARVVFQSLLHTEKKLFQYLFCFRASKKASAPTEEQNTKVNYQYWNQYGSLDL